MIKKIGVFVCTLTFFWACVPLQPPPPSLHIEIPSSILVTELSLDERIAVEEAWSSLRQGKTARAEKILSRLSSTSPFYYAGLGYASFIREDYQAAEKFFQQALALRPEMTLPHMGLAQLYQKTGREDLAFNEYAEVLKREPENTWAQKEFSVVQAEKTEESLRQAKSFLSQGDAEKSKEAYLKALHYYPKSQEANLALAAIYNKEKNFQNALLHLKAALDNDPKNTEILRNYADTLFESRQYPKSLDFYERLLDIDPQNKHGKNRLENLKNRLGIVELPSQYNSIPSSPAVTKEEVAALIGVKFKEYLNDAPPQKPTVIIDISTSWASKSIIQTASFEIMEVYPNHTFQPKKEVTRAEMAVSLVRLINFLKKEGLRILPQIPLEKIQLLDVPADNYYYKPIAQIISYQIMDLSPDRTFRPESGLSGQEALKLLNILLGLIK
ncbi:MAG: tetratricopeptide repeat protein [Candidatus Aminicenantales bacterium]